MPPTYDHTQIVVMLDWALHMHIFVLRATEIGWNCLGVAESKVWPAAFKPQGMKGGCENAVLQSGFVPGESLFIKDPEPYNSSTSSAEAGEYCLMDCKTRLSWDRERGSNLPTTRQCKLSQKSAGNLAGTALEGNSFPARLYSPTKGVLSWPFYWASGLRAPMWSLPVERGGN